MSDPDCVFCKIVAGEIPAELVRADEQFLAFHDTEPAADDHVLVIPREHHSDLDAFVTAGGSSRRMLRFVSDTATDAGIDGRYRLITNVGEAAGQAVFHLHWHLLAGTRIPGFPPY